MLCVFYGIHKPTTASGIDAALVALTFDQPVSLVFLDTTPNELAELNEPLEKLKQYGLSKAYLASDKVTNTVATTERVDDVNTDEATLTLPVEAIGMTELRYTMLNHSPILSF